MAASQSTMILRVREHSSKPVTSTRMFVALAIAGMVGPIIFLVLSLIAAELRPDYSPTRQYISDLGVGAHAWIQNAGFVTVGLSLVASGRAGFKQLLPGSRSTGRTSILGVLVGIGLILLAIFPEDQWPGTRTASGTVHVLTFFVISVLATAGCLDAAWHFKADAGDRAVTFSQLGLGRLFYQAWSWPEPHSC